MRQDLFDLLEYGQDIGLIMSVSPSVTSLITRERLNRLFDLGISRLSFSLDGSNAEIHDSFRGVPGSFDMTMARMRDALDVGLSLQINTVVSRHTLKDLPKNRRHAGNLSQDGVVGRVLPGPHRQRPARRRLFARGTRRGISLADGA